MRNDRQEGHAEVGAAPEDGIAERTLEFSSQLIRFFRTLGRSDEARLLGRQVLKSGTSIGANVHEAQSAQSRADFLCKMQIAHKEARETAYWLMLLSREHLGDAAQLAPLRAESARILRLLSAIVITTKRRSRPTRSLRNP